MDPHHCQREPSNSGPYIILNETFGLLKPVIGAATKDIGN